MRTSVVIPAFNGKKYFEENLLSVIKMRVDEVVIVDDASTDQTVEFLEKQFPEVKLVRHQKNMGFPISVNDGFAIATGDVVFLLNQDLKPDKDLVRHSIRHFNKPDVFAVTFNEGNHSWADGKWENGMLEFKNGELDNKLHNSFWPSGGGSAIRRDLWNKVGGFDPIFSPGYFEDLDIGLRISKLNFKTVWDPKCLVNHKVEGIFPKSFSKKKLQHIKERNYLLAVWKNIDQKLWPKHLKSLFLRIVKGPGYLIPVIWALWRKLAS